MADEKKNEPVGGEESVGNGAGQPPQPINERTAAELAADEALLAAAGEPAPRHHDDVIADLRREISDLKDKILRAHAEVDNIRKRTEQEKKDTAKYAVTKFAHDVVNVSDNFQRAVQAVPTAAADHDPALTALIEGVNLTEREFLNVLERHGVKRVDPKGDVFNPHLHQAVMQQPSADAAPNTVLQVFQSGFTIEDRVLRPAMVVVATAMPKPAPPEPPPAADAPPATAAEAPPTAPAEQPTPTNGPVFGKRNTPPGENTG